MGLSFSGEGQPGEVARRCRLGWRPGVGRERSVAGRTKTGRSLWGRGACSTVWISEIMTVRSTTLNHGGYSANFPQQWFSADGKSMRMVGSACCGGVGYTYHATEVRLETNDDYRIDPNREQ